MNNKRAILKKLEKLNFLEDEAKLYTELLERLNTHLQLARATGINRTKVYRIINQLEKRSLVLRRTDDRGIFLLANDPDILEIELAVREEKVKQQRQTLERVLTELQSLRAEQASPFAVHTYEGVEGFRQMQWNELKTQGELFVLGNVTVEQLTASRRWSENFRQRASARGYRTREIINKSYEPLTFSEVTEFLELYEARFIPEEELPMSTPMVIYNDTVAVYQFDNEKRVGAEIINTAYAETMRSIFEHYWRQAKSRP